MELIVIITSILFIAAIVWLLNHWLPFRICPICAGVSGTSLWMLTGIIFGYLQTTHYRLLTAILMSGSVVGIAYQLEKRLPKGASALLWKTIFIPIGFVAVYLTVQEEWLSFAIAILAECVVAIAFVSKRKITKKQKRSGNGTVQELEKKMEQCCE